MTLFAAALCSSAAPQISGPTSPTPGSGTAPTGPRGLRRYRRPPCLELQWRTTVAEHAQFCSVAPRAVRSHSRPVRGSGTAPRGLREPSPCPPPQGSGMPWHTTPREAAWSSSEAMVRAVRSATRGSSMARAGPRCFRQPLHHLATESRWPSTPPAARSFSSAGGDRAGVLVIPGSGMEPPGLSAARAQRLIPGSFTRWRSIRRRARQSCSAEISSGRTRSVRSTTHGNGMGASGHWTGRRLRPALAPANHWLSTQAEGESCFLGERTKPSRRSSTTTPGSSGPGLSPLQAIPPPPSIPPVWASGI